MGNGTGTNMLKVPMRILWVDDVTISVEVSLISSCFFSLFLPYQILVILITQMYLKRSNWYIWSRLNLWPIQCKFSNTGIIAQIGTKYNETWNEMVSEGEGLEKRKERERESNEKESEGRVLQLYVCVWIVIQLRCNCWGKVLQLLTTWRWVLVWGQRPMERGREKKEEEERKSFGWMESTLGNWLTQDLDYPRRQFLNNWKWNGKSFEYTVRIPVSS